MISASAWAARVKTTALVKAVKVQSSNTTADVNLGIRCPRMSYSQLIYKIPKCQLYKHLQPCKPVILPSTLFGGYYSDSGDVLFGGTPTVSGDVLSMGRI